MKLRTAWFGLQLSDTDVLTLGAYLQKYLGYVLQDMFGTTAAQYTGLTVTPTSAKLAVDISVGRLYQQQAAIATQWGSTPTGLGPDATTITKQGALETALGAQYLGVFAVPGSGTNYYTIQAICVDQDINPTGRTFTPSPNVETSQIVTIDRVTAVVLSLKGPSTSAPPAVDAGNTAIATIAIPAGATNMLSGYITQLPQYPGTAGILAGGSFIQLSPGGAQSGFMNITGTVTCGSVSTGSVGCSGLTAAGLVAANAGLNVGGALANLNAQAVIGTAVGTGAPLVVNGITGGTQSAPLVQAFLQPGGTLVFKISTDGGISFGGGGGGLAQLKVGSTMTRLIPAAAGLQFSVRNAADTTTNLQVLDAGGVTVYTTGVSGVSCVLPLYTAAGAGYTGSARAVSFSGSISAGSNSVVINLSGDAQITPLCASAVVFDDGHGPYDNNHFVKSVVYNAGAKTLTITIDSNAVTNPCHVAGFITP